MPSIIGEYMSAMDDKADRHYLQPNLVLENQPKNKPKENPNNFYETRQKKEDDLVFHQF